MVACATLSIANFGLVRKALIERETILEIAPHLTRPLKLVLIHSSRHRPRWLMRMGLLIYDNLGGRKRIPSTATVDLRNSLEGSEVRGEFSRAFAYWDVWVDDSRLVILNARDAGRRGAKILRATEFVSAHRESGLWTAVSVLDGREPAPCACAGNCQLCRPLG